MKVWLELAVKNARETKKNIEQQLKGVDFLQLKQYAKQGSQAASSGRSALDAAGGAGAASGSLGKIAGSVGAIVGVLFAIKKINEGLFNEMRKSSPYLQGMLNIMGKAWMLFWRPIGDFVANLLRPLAIALLKLSVKWLKFTRTPAGEVTTSAIGGGMIGAGTGATVGAIAGGVVGAAGGPLGAVVGAAGGAVAGGVIGGMIGSTIALLDDAWVGLKNAGTIIKAWNDYLVKEIFGIDMNKVREAVVKFLYVTIPEFFTEKLPEWFRKQAGKLGDFAGFIWDKVTTAVSNVKTKLKDFADHIWELMKGGVSNVIDTLSGWGQWLLDKIKTPFGDLYNLLKDWTHWLWYNLIDGVSNVYSKLTNFAGHVYNKMTNAISNIPSWLSGIGRYMYKKVTSSIKDAFRGFRFGWNWWWGQDSGNQKGLDYVPETGMYKLHRGEKVLTSSRSDGGKSTNIVLSPTFNISSNGNMEDAESQIRRMGRMLEFETRRRSYL